MYIALVWKNGVFQATGVETINPSINQSIAINPVGDCSERTVLGFRSSLLVIICPVLSPPCTRVSFVSG